eukprot:11158406-Lingulodinium_polyedra.AAC.1
MAWRAAWCAVRGAGVWSARSGARGAGRWARGAGRGAQGAGRRSSRGARVMAWGVAACCAARRGVARGTHRTNS